MSLCPLGLDSSNSADACVSSVPVAVFFARTVIVNPGTLNPNPNPSGLFSVQPAGVTEAVFHVPASAPALPGTRYDALAPSATSTVRLNISPNPRSASCGGYCGAYCCSTVTPSGLTSARYSPPFASEKFVCSTPPATRRSFPDANTTRNSPGAIVTAGNRHFPGFPALSVRLHPPMLNGAVDGL